MNERDWKRLESQLDDHMYVPVKIEADGYKVGLSLISKGIMILSINGKMNRSFFETDCEERKRFMRPGKVNNTAVYTYIWESFDKLKNHLIKNNRKIRLVRE